MQIALLIFHLTACYSGPSRSLCCRQMSSELRCVVFDPIRGPYNTNEINPFAVSLSVALASPKYVQPYHGPQSPRDVRVCQRLDACASCGPNQRNDFRFFISARFVPNAQEGDKVPCEQTESCSRIGVFAETHTNVSYVWRLGKPSTDLP